MPFRRRRRRACIVRSITRGQATSARATPYRYQRVFGRPFTSAISVGKNRARAKDQNQPSRPDRVAAENSDNSVEVISTGARLNVLVASRPPKPAPSVTTVGFDCGIVLTTAMSSLARQCGSVSPLFYRCTADGFAPRRDHSSPGAARSGIASGHRRTETAESHFARQFI
jgi:hypothetical protein